MYYTESQYRFEAVYSQRMLKLYLIHIELHLLPQNSHFRAECVITTPAHQKIFENTIDCILNYPKFHTGNEINRLFAINLVVFQRIFQKSMLKFKNL